MKSKKYKETIPKKVKICNIIYLFVILIVFESIGLMFFIFPRSTESERELRKLKTFPEFTVEALFSGSYTADLCEYFADTVPFRDDLTAMAADISDLNGIKQEIQLHNVVVPPPVQPPVQTTAPKPAESKPPEDQPDEPVDTPDVSEPEQTTTITEPEGNEPIEEVDTPVNTEDSVNIINNGIAVVGDKALMLYGGNYDVGTRYAEVINKYKAMLGDDVNVYSMIIPTAVEFYAPDEIKPYTNSQLKNINHVIDNLSDDVKAVDVYTTLGSHLNEYIYMRTDHHWASLGAYYAAEKFAADAGVPFMDISEYEKRTVKNYVGTMYGYTGASVLKDNPEDFNYYVPNGVEYTTTYYTYLLDENGAISGMMEPYEDPFFYRYSDGNSLAYCTFMGGDSKITHVHTDTANGRKLAILKDSYGNALPPFLFGSFEDIYVIDMRYFTYNAVDYFEEQGITDVLFANNAFHAATASTVTYYERFLTQ